MIVAMQGNWKVTVKSKNASYAQRFIISGATIGNGVHAGVPGTSVNVVGNQWSIAIQNNPGAGFQLSDIMVKFPHRVGCNYVFDIWSNDAGSDKDFNDLVLTCSTPVNINDFIVFGNVSQYRKCIFNPRRKDLYVIETKEALAKALINPKIRQKIEELYPERIPRVPEPGPDPSPFKPIVIDLYEQAMQPRTNLTYKRLAGSENRASKKVDDKELESPFAAANFSLLKSSVKTQQAKAVMAVDRVDLVKIIDGFFRCPCINPVAGITLTFEEYDRTAAELAGGAYSGTGNRQLLGETITDMFGNYIFRFRFDMTFPGLADAADIAPGEDVNVIPYPDVIVKVKRLAPYETLYESAPYYNISNLKRIDLCLPKNSVPTSGCFNGNLIGELGNVFIGGNQNSAASFADVDLIRDEYAGNGNYLGADGKISVNNPSALFTVDCAAWGGVVDIKGCMYDTQKTAAQNTIKWYTIRIKRDGSGYPWQFVSQNYKHRQITVGDVSVGPIFKTLRVDGGPPQDNIPAYKNIQREMYVDGTAWVPTDITRYMQLNTRLYDVIDGEHVPGKFYVKVDCYDDAGNVVPNATDMIALFIHNKPFEFELQRPSFIDPAVMSLGCGLYRLTEAQLNSPMKLSFKANDQEGFVDSYNLAMSRCPGPMLALQVNVPVPPLGDTPAGASSLAQGNAAGNVHPACTGYSGTLDDFIDAGLIDVEFQPAASEGGWIKPGENFTALYFSLTARKRVTNGYNSGTSDHYRYVSGESGHYHRTASIYLEPLAL